MKTGLVTLKAARENLLGILPQNCKNSDWICITMKCILKLQPYVIIFFFPVADEIAQKAVPSLPYKPLTALFPSLHLWYWDYIVPGSAKWSDSKIAKGLLLRVLWVEAEGKRQIKWRFIFHPDHFKDPIHNKASKTTGEDRQGRGMGGVRGWDGSVFRWLWCHSKHWESRWSIPTQVK